MNHLSRSFLTAPVLILSLALAKTAVADPFALTGACGLPSSIANRCGLTIRLIDIGTTTKTISSVSFYVDETDKNGKILSLDKNGKAKSKLVYTAYNDAKNPASAFATFASASNVAVTCGKYYKVHARVLGSDTPNISSQHVLTCPSNKDL